MGELLGVLELVCLDGWRLQRLGLVAAVDALPEVL